MNIGAQFSLALDAVRPGKEWEKNVHDAVSVSAYNFSNNLLLPNEQNSIYIPWWTFFDTIQQSLKYDVMSNNYRHELIERGYILVGKEDAFKTGKNISKYGDKLQFGQTVSLSGGEGWRNNMHDHINSFTMYEIRNNLFTFLLSRDGMDGSSAAVRTIRRECNGGDWS